MSASYAAPPSTPSDPAKVEFFEKKIRPLLLENCINCHSAENGGKGGLRVDDRNGLIEGGGRGPSIKPGKPEESLLIKAVRHKGPSMPPNKTLTDEQIAAVKQNPEGVSCEDSTTHRLDFIVDEHFHRRALLALRQQHDLSAIRQAVAQMEAGAGTHFTRLVSNCLLRS